MALNPYMHPRNPYKTPADFKALAIKYPEFRAVAKTELNGTVSVDFKDRNAVRVLTMTLLKADFGLTVFLPPSKLVPTLPLRLNYLLWIEDLLIDNEYDSTRDVIGLDVGVGASCIYPLLATTHFHWKMIGTDIHEESLKLAQENVIANKLEDKIKLVRQDSLDLKCLGLSEGTLVFTMSNPPFFDETKEEEGGENPAGSDHEMKTQGGEIEFIKALYVASMSVQESTPLFTCMIGHKSSVKALRKFFYDERASSNKLKFVVTEFCQGKTMRWGIAWSFVDDFHLSENSLLKQKQTEKKKNIPVSFHLDQLGPGLQITDCVMLFQQFKTWLEAIDIKIKLGKVKEEKFNCELVTFDRNWQNQRRKRREQQRKLKQEEELLMEGPSAKRSRVDALELSNPQAEPKELQLSCQVLAKQNLEDKSRVDFKFFLLDGVAGKDGMFQLIQMSKYYVLHSKMAIQEDDLHEFKGHRTISCREINKMHTQEDKNGEIFLTRKPICYSICAFINAGKGGTLFLGVLDNGSIQGIMLSEYQKDHVRLSVYNSMSNCEPEVPDHMYKVNFVPVVCENDSDKPFETYPRQMNEEERSLEHKIFSPGNCWCDAEALALFNNGFLCPLYVIEISIAPWNPKDPRNESLIKKISPNVLPQFKNEDGKCFIRTNASIERLK